MGQEQLQEPARTEIARLVLLEEIRHRLDQGDEQAANDVREALDEVDSSDWVSLLTWSCILAGKIDERKVMP
jgi:hypothetical protein